jgi:exo-beta-1,3-glucanase (GH17 family)
VTLARAVRDLAAVLSVCLTFACTLEGLAELRGSGAEADAGMSPPGAEDGGADGAARDPDSGRGDMGPPDASDSADAGMEPASTRREIPAAVLARRGIAYSGYRLGQQPGGTIPTESQMREDLGLIVAAGFGRIRLFDSGPHAEQALRVIASGGHDLKVQLGLWVVGSDQASGTGNRVEINRAIRLAKLFPDLVAMISVGDNTISARGMPAADLAMYISLVREQVTQPVGFDEKASMLKAGGYPDLPALYGAADFVGVQLMHLTEAAESSWDWKQTAVAEAQRARATIDAGMSYVKAQFTGARAAIHEHAPGMVLILDETGWKDRASQPANLSLGHIEGYMSHPINQLWMHDDLNAWVYGSDKGADSPHALTLFEAFDEPWKGDDDHWGVFDETRTAKYVIWARVPVLRPSDAVVPASSEAVYYRP